MTPTSLFLTSAPSWTVTVYVVWCYVKWRYVLWLVRCALLQYICDCTSESTLHCQWHNRVHINFLSLRELRAFTLEYASEVDKWIKKLEISSRNKGKMQTYVKVNSGVVCWKNTTGRKSWEFLFKHYVNSCIHGRSKKSRRALNFCKLFCLFLYVDHLLLLGGDKLYLWSRYFTTGKL
jgi:hypothetical protein